MGMPMIALSEIDFVSPCGDVCGEGAVWCPEDGRVYWCDINRFLIHAFDLSDRSTRTWLFDEPVVALSLTSEQGRMLVALGSRLIWWWPHTDRRSDHGFSLPGWPQVRLNDGRADPLGNFWIGSMGNNVLPTGEGREVGGTPGVLYRIDPRGGVSEWKRDIGISNTLCWSPGGRTFYFGDTLANRIDAYDCDPQTGDIGSPVPYLVGFERGLPDGSAIDEEGCIWNCRFFGRCIVRVSPRGEVLQVIEMPFRNITTAVFGGDDLSPLFVTSASGGGKDPYDRLAGSLMAIGTSTRGLAPTRVQIAAD